MFVFAFGVNGVTREECAKDPRPVEVLDLNRYPNNSNTMVERGAEGPRYAKVRSDDGTHRYPFAEDREKSLYKALGWSIWPAWAVASC